MANGKGENLRWSKLVKLVVLNETREGDSWPKAMNLISCRALRVRLRIRACLLAPASYLSPKG